jgi:AraC-like DNA-binding protein
MFLVISIAMMAMTVPFFVWVSAQFSHYAYSEIQKLSGDKLNQTLENTEFIFRKLKDYGLRMYDDPALKNWMYSAYEDGVIQSEARNSITKFKAFEPFISKIVMVNLMTGRVFDSQDGLVQKEDYPDQGMLDILDESRDGILEYFVYPSDGKQVMALLFPSGSKAPYSGYLFITLDTEALRTYLLQFNKEIGVQVAILNEDGKPVLGEMDDRLSQEIAAKGQSIHDGPFTFRQGQDSWIVNYTSMRSQSWSIYYLTRMNEFKSKVERFQYLLAGSAAAILLTLLAFLYWNLRANIRPFSRLALNLQQKLDFQGREGTFDDGKELGVLERGIDLLVNKVDDFRSSIRDHQGLIKEDFLRQWVLNGKLSSHTKPYLESNTSLLVGSMIQLAVLRIEGYQKFADTYDFSSRKLMKYAMGNIAEEIMSGRKFAVESLDMGGDHVVVLIGCEEADLVETSALLEEIQRQIERWVKIETAAAISDLRHPEDDIHFSYEHVHELTLLKFVNGEDKVYREDDYETYMKMIEPLPGDAELDNLIQAVRAGRAEKVELFLDRLVQNMQSLPYRECQFQLTLILYTIIRAFHSIMDQANARSIQKFLEQFNTLMEVRNWLATELIKQIEIPDRGEGGTGRKLEITGEIVEYIRSRLHDPMLNIDQIADHISLSVRYIRQIFKDSVGTSIADYLLAERIRHVKMLLVETELSIADIAERSGFQTKSHFFTVFKKSTGLTPNEYRQMHKE